MKYIIANFKSHKTKGEIESWLEQFQAHAALDTKLILALPFPYLQVATTKLDVAAQDVSPFPPGSYTGAVSAVQLADCQIKYCLVGHSERRKYFHETSMAISNKVRELLSVGITPVVCVSEADLSEQFATLEDEQIKKCLFAYETLADIGGTTTTPLEQIRVEIDVIRGYTKNSSLGILYGGSVNAGNIATLTGLVDGVLVATASLDPDNFSLVVQGFAPHV